FLKRLLICLIVDGLNIGDSESLTTIQLHLISFFIVIPSAKTTVVKITSISSSTVSFSIMFLYVIDFLLLLVIVDTFIFLFLSSLAIVLIRSLLLINTNTLVCFNAALIASKSIVFELFLTVLLSI